MNATLPATSSAMIANLVVMSISPDELLPEWEEEDLLSDDLLCDDDDFDFAEDDLYVD